MASSSKQPMRDHTSGYSLLEILIVIAIAGILMFAGLTAVRRVQTGGEENGFITNLSLSIKSSAAFASSRRERVIMTRAGNRINFVNAAGLNIDDNNGLAIPQSVTTSIPEGNALIFGANGTVVAPSPPPTYTASTTDRIWSIKISLIGDTKIEERGR